MNKLRKSTKQDKSGCWIWSGAKSYSGYGRIRHEGKQWAVHRLAYYLHYGEFDLKLNVCHRCDVRNCANPFHLFLASHKVNMKDRQKKNRQAKGTEINTAKLKEKDVEQIRWLHFSKKIKYKELSQWFSVTESNIRYICAYKTWKHIK